MASISNGFNYLFLLLFSQIGTDFLDKGNCDLSGLCCLLICKAKVHNKVLYHIMTFLYLPSTLPLASPLR
jgi:hypothetical protein